MEGNAISFKEVFEKGKYKNFTVVTDEVVTPKEIFKSDKITKRKQFSFRIRPMKYWHRNMAKEARDTYVSTGSISLALHKAGRTFADLFPDKKEGDEIDFAKDVNISVWYDISPYMLNCTASESYHKTVFEMVREYTDTIVLSGGVEEDFSESFEVVSQEPRYMQFLFNEMLRISTATEDEKDAAK